MRTISLFTFIIFLVLFNSCLEGPEDKTHVALNKKPETAVAEKTALPDLHGTVYHFNALIDKASCKLTEKEDSTGWDLLFVNDSQFVWTYYFPSDVDYSKGKYRIENDTVFLSIEYGGVSRTYAKVTSTAQELMAGSPLKKQYLSPSNKKVSNASREEKIYAGKCDEGTTFLIWHNPTLTQILPEDNAIKLSVSSEDYIKQMKADGVWEMLGMK